MKKKRHNKKLKKQKPKKKPKIDASVILWGIGSFLGLGFLYLIGVMGKDPTGGFLSEHPHITFAAILSVFLGLLVWLILPGIYKK